MIAGLVLVLWIAGFVWALCQPPGPPNALGYRKPRFSRLVLFAAASIAVAFVADLVQG